MAPLSPRRVTSCIWWAGRTAWTSFSASWGGTPPRSHIAPAEGLNIGGGGKAEQPGDLHGGGVLRIDGHVNFQVAAQLGHAGGILRVADGKVGFSLAEQLAKEEHNVTVVDSNEEALRRAGDQLDVMTVRGNGVSAATLLGKLKSTNRQSGYSSVRFSSALPPVIIRSTPIWDTWV